MRKNIKFMGIGIIFVIVIIIGIFFGVKIPTVYDTSENSMIINPKDLLLVVLIIYSLTSTFLFIIILRKSIEYVKIIDKLTNEEP